MYFPRRAQRLWKLRERPRRAPILEPSNPAVNSVMTIKAYVTSINAPHNAIGIFQIQTHPHPPNMLFVVNPYATEPEYLDPEDAYVEFKRREYIAALEERQRRVQFERELEREEQRHRLALASIARQEAERRRREQQYQIQRQRELQQLQQLAAREQTQRRQQLQPEQRPSREEILTRRRALQEEEERRSRELHKQILSRIFGVPVDDDGNEVNQAESTSAKKPSPPTEQTGAKKQTADAPPTKAPEPSQAPKSTELSPPTEAASESPVDADVDAHWSNAPERARALAEITSLGRIFAALKNTFVFPEGQLERLAGSDTPRLAYNSTNATIHAYEHALSELLSKLDTIESHGFKGVREARKQLVTSIEQELSLLEEKVSQRLASVDVPAAPQEISIPIEDVTTHNTESSKIEEAPIQDVVQDTAPREDAPEDPAAPKEVSISIEGASNLSEVPSKPQDTIAQVVQGEAPASTTQEVSSAPAERVQPSVTEQEPTTSTTEPVGESSRNVDATEEAPEDQAVSDIRPNREASAEDDPDVTRNQEGEVTVTERAPPESPADDVPDDGEDSEVEDAVQVMLEPQRTAVPAGEEHEYELV